MTSKREMKKQLEKLNAKKAKERAKKKAQGKPRQRRVVEEVEDEEEKRFRINWRVVLPLLILVAGFFFGSYIYTNNTVGAKLVKDYYQAIADKDYLKAYSLCTTEMGEAEFIERLKNIYEGIEASNIGVTIISNNLVEENSSEINDDNSDDATRDTTNEQKTAESGCREHEVCQGSGIKLREVRSGCDGTPECECGGFVRGCHTL